MAIDSHAKRLSAIGVRRRTLPPPDNNNAEDRYERWHFMRRYALQPESAGVAGVAKIAVRIGIAL